MSAPKPWRDLDGGASPEVRELLRRARPSQGMNYKMTAKLGMHAAKLAVKPIPTMLAVFTPKAFLLMSTLVVAGGSVTAVVVRSHSHPTHAMAHSSSMNTATLPTAAQTPILPTIENPVETDPIVPVPVPEAIVPVTMVPNPSGSFVSLPRHVVHLEEIPPAHIRLSEDDMLDRAREALTSDPAAALARIDQYTAAYPRGQLEDLREVIAIDALHRLRRDAAARHRGETFLRRFPESLYAERIARMIASESP